MATVNQLLDQLQARGYGFDLDTVQIQLLESAYNRILNARRWTFLDATETVQLPAGQSNIDLAIDLTGDVRFLDAVRFDDYDDPRFLPYQQFMHDSQDGSTGVPRLWTVRNGEVLFHPTPTVTLDVSIDYNERPDALSSLTPAVDDIALPDPYDELVVLGAIKEMAFRERDWDARAAAQQDYNVLLGECLAEHGLEQRQNSKNVVNSGFFDPFEVEVYEEVI